MNRRRRKSRKTSLRMSAARNSEQFVVVDGASDGRKMRICGESESGRSDEESWSGSRGWPQSGVGRSDATS